MKRKPKLTSKLSVSNEPNLKWYATIEFGGYRTHGFGSTREKAEATAIANYEAQLEQQKMIEQSVQSRFLEEGI